MVIDSNTNQMSNPNVLHLPASLDIRDVSKIYTTADGASVFALSQTSLRIKPSEFVTLIGPSGCGKSTLLRLIAGLERPTSGSIYADQSFITQPDASRGVVFQDPNLFPWLTVRRSIETGLRAQGLLDRRGHQVEEFMRVVELEQFANVYPHQLSGGMAQRVALARALINDPSVLLLDEPLGALDAFTRMKLQDEVLRLWRARGTTMLLVTHDIDEAIYMSDRIAIMSPRPGRIDCIIDVELPRPRQRTAAEFMQLRAKILEMLHFSGGNESTE